MMGVPTQYSRLLADERFDASACSSIRLFTSGSAPMTAAVHAEFTERTGHQILERYGMTEAGMITSNPYDGERVPGTVGFALPGVDLRVADTTGVPSVRARPASSRSAAPDCLPGTGSCPTRRQPSSDTTGGSSPATSAPSTTRGGSPWKAGRAT